MTLSKDQPFPIVQPASLTQVNWQVLINESEAHFGRSLTRNLDLNKIPLSPQAYVQAMSWLDHSISFENPFAYDLVSMGFLVVAPVGDQLSFLRTTNASSAGTFEFCIYTQTIREWQATVPVICSERKPERTRFIGNRIFEFIEQAGFRGVFGDYEKQALNDRTFTLCQRKR